MSGQSGFRHGWLCMGVFSVMALFFEALPAQDSTRPRTDNGRTAPCADFFLYACGHWIHQHEIPADDSGWTPMFEVMKSTSEKLRKILEAAASSREPRDATSQRIGDYYSACMDEPAVEMLGAVPLQPVLNRLRSLTSSQQAMLEAGELGRLRIFSLYKFISQPDPRDSNRIIGALSRPELTLDEPNSYLRENGETRALRQGFLAYYAELFRLVGLDQQSTESAARTMWATESALARIGWSRESAADPRPRMTFLSIDAIEQRAPKLRLRRVLSNYGVPAHVDIAVPRLDFLVELNAWIGNISSKDLATYLSGRYLHFVADIENSAPPSAFLQARVKFNELRSGQSEAPPRWRRCTEAVNSQLGEALGRKFVERYFSSENKAKVTAMAKNILTAVRGLIEASSWLEPATKVAAIEKADAIRISVGFPDRWRSYDGLIIRRQDAFGNRVRAIRFEHARQMRMIGQAVDRSEWPWPPQTVNAGYAAQLNTIFVPAGILQAPYFDPLAQDATNYGAIGASIGHEYMHGFDNRGRLYDKDGNLRDWWSRTDEQAYNSRAECFIRQYDGFEVLDGLHVNGRLTLGENIADVEGLRAAYKALERELSRRRKRIDDVVRPGEGTFAQLFFLSFAESSCAKHRPEAIRSDLLTNPHAPDNTRVNGSVMNNPGFQSAFSCPASNPMTPAKTCHIW
jgi:putative endopeptidase